MERVLILAGDAVEDLELFFILYRLREAGYAVDVAAPSRRTLRTVVHDFEPDSDAYVEKPGRRLEPDLAFSEVEPERYVGLVIPGGGHPNTSGSTPTCAGRLALLRQRPAGRHPLPRAAGSGRSRVACRAARARGFRPSAPTSRPPAAPTSRGRTWSTGTWSRAAAGATWRSGRRRSSPRSSARPFPPNRAPAQATREHPSSTGAPCVTSTRSTGSSRRGRSASRPSSNRSPIQGSSSQRPPSRPMITSPATSARCSESRTRTLRVPRRRSPRRRGSSGRPVGVEDAPRRTARPASASCAHVRRR